MEHTRNFDGTSRRAPTANTRTADLIEKAETALANLRQLVLDNQAQKKGH